jgi:queuine/archaeosine tRNA-ribosyltransferase
MYSDPCTIALQTDKKLMTIHNPYVANLVEMGYDVADCQMVASAGVKDTYPREIHGRVFNTEEEYSAALADFINGL